ncbi:MAG: geranylgeranyl reductase family protein [Motilibacteraceae bacterium]
MPAPSAAEPTAQPSAQPSAPRELRTELLVVGAGPAGAAAAAWAARAGHEVLLVDRADFPRDKTCGDGLTPRAVAELDALGLGEWLRAQHLNVGLRARGFGQELFLRWPTTAEFQGIGSAVPRTELDARIRQVALDAGAAPLTATAVGADVEGGAISAVHLRDADGPLTVRAERVVVADGARSQLGRHLGRHWDRSTAYGVAARAYVEIGAPDDLWISSDLELRDAQGEVLPGYGWVFPLGGGRVNIGVGTLATDARPADVNLRRLLDTYTDTQRDQWDIKGEPQRFASALLPMGGAVSGIAGRNWVMVGDAAGCVNPLNGEGIDYGLETGRLAADLLFQLAHDVATAWPALLRRRYGVAFSVARRAAALLTHPRFVPTFGPAGMRSPLLMKLALRVMGNLVTEEDTDTLARAWRLAGLGSLRLDPVPPFPGPDLRRAG